MQMSVKKFSVQSMHKHVSDDGDLPTIADENVTVGLPSNQGSEYLNKTQALVRAKK